MAPFLPKKQVNSFDANIPTYILNILIYIFLIIQHSIPLGSRTNDSNKPITKVYSEQYILEVDTEEVKYPGNFQMFIEVIDQHGNVSNNHATTLGLGLTSGITFLPPNSPLNQSIKLYYLLLLVLPPIFIIFYIDKLRGSPTKNKTNLKKQI